MSQPDKAVCLVFLSVCAVWDIRERKIPFMWICLTGVLSLVMAVLEEQLLFSALGILPGMILVVMSLITKGGVGMGDAYVCMVTGCFTGMWGSFLVIITGSLLVSVWGMVNIFIRHLSIKRSVPFTPFLLLSYIIVIFFMGGY